MKTQIVQLHLMDEFRTCGCGMRRVELKRGREWVYVRPTAIPDAHWSKMRVNRFDREYPQSLIDKWNPQPKPKIERYRPHGKI